MNSLARRNNNFVSFIDILDGFFSLDRFVDDVFGSNNSTRANVIDTAESRIVEVEAPGFKKEDFKISVEKRFLSVEVCVKNENKNMLHREFYKKSFKRLFNLPEGALENNIVAKYDAGILTVKIPVNKNEKSSKIIQVV